MSNIIPWQAVATAPEEEVLSTSPDDRNVRIWSGHFQGGEVHQDFHVHRPLRPDEARKVADKLRKLTDPNPSNGDGEAPDG